MNVVLIMHLVSAENRNGQVERAGKEAPRPAARLQKLSRDGSTAALGGRSGHSGHYLESTMYANKTVHAG